MAWIVAVDGGDFVSAGAALFAALLGFLGAYWVQRSSLAQERELHAASLAEARAAAAEERADSRHREEAERSEQRLRRMLDRQAEVYVQLIRLIRREDDKTFDSHSLLSGVRSEPKDYPVVDDEAGIDAAVLAFASPEIRRLKLIWNQDVYLIARVLQSLATTEDVIKQMEYRVDYELSAEVAHQHVVEIEAAVRTELAHLSQGGEGPVEVSAS